MHLTRNGQLSRYECVYSAVNDLVSQGLSVTRAVERVGVKRDDYYNARRRILKQKCPGGSTPNQGGDNAPGDQGETATKDTTGDNQP